MVNVGDFKLLANGADVTAKIRANLINLSYDDKEGDKSDEISFVVNGLYKKPFFGDNLELWLGYVDRLYHCGKFSVQTVTKNYKANTTEVRATAVNFASKQKEAKRRTWENTTLFGIANKIADENKLSFKGVGDDIPVLSKLQNNVSDIEFLYTLCFELGYLMGVKNNTITITTKEGKAKALNGAGVSAKNESLPRFVVSLSECVSLSITEANRHSYDSVVVGWHDNKSGKDNEVKVGKGKQVYKMQIPEPKADSEALKMGESKLNELQRGGLSGSCSLLGKELRAGGKISFKDVGGVENIEFSIKSVRHNLSSSGYFIDVEFEG
ncbi:phage protein D [Campylobacter pinnipediorum subsp. pinnipediorum]|uniref:phage late control D family protein n=1 Tax=Campylobacter pinnipediorum TaxID=1965231 RepID=UPI0009951874|nr:phage tail protein [Campylobacter pinnipediorum]AQW80808.1 phage protein D [Campylobacter pinnipediorum subsp. pinnipediorum]